MYKLRLSLMAVLCVSAGLNAGDAGYAMDQVFNLLVRTPGGSATAVHYVNKKVAIVDQMPAYANNIKKYGIDIAAGHVVHNVVVRPVIDKQDKRTGTAVASDACKDAAISLALTNYILPAAWNVARRMHVSCYFDFDPELKDAAKSTAYGLAHGACRVGLDALIATAQAYAAGNASN